MDRVYDRKEVRNALWFGVAILAVGALRFVLTVSGVADDTVKYASMWAVILAGCFYFGVQVFSYRQLLVVAYLLILPYMTVELLALGYTWMSGRHTIFHVPQYSFNTPIHVHFWGHLIGGLTWEPLAVFLVMAAIRKLYVLARPKARP